jgi:hypothetical protein
MYALTVAVLIRGSARFQQHAGAGNWPEAPDQPRSMAANRAASAVMSSVAC